MRSWNWPPAVAALIIGLALVIGTLITAQTINYVKTFDTSLLNVTGTAQEIVTSDAVEWDGSFTTTVALADMKAGYQTMSSDQGLVLSYLTKSGVPAKDVTFSPVSQSLNYVDCKASPAACNGFGPDTYQLTENVRVQSSDVQQITKLAQNTGTLIQEGVLFSTQNLSYYYTKLQALRPKLLAAATRDAQDRARQITASVGGSVGQLVSVTTEPFEVTPVNSAQVSNAGLYDTSTIRKQVQAIVQATFRLP